MQLGSGEHYGWDQPRTAELVALLAGPDHSPQYAWIRVPEGAKGGPLDVMVTRRGDNLPWETPQQGVKVQVAAWALSSDQQFAVEVELEEACPRWVPHKPRPDLWLWLKG